MAPSPPEAIGTPVEPSAAGSPTKGKDEAPRGHGPLIPTVLSWPLFAVFPPFALPTWGWALWRAARRGRRSVLGAVLLCPLVAVPLLSAGLALVGYATGTATLEGRGLPGPGYSNLDRTLRCRQSSGGCVVTGHEPFTILPNNLVLHALGAVLGAMPGAYDGPYPTEDEAFALLARTAPTTVRAHASALTVDGKAVDPALLQLLDSSSLEKDAWRGDDETYRLALVDGRCLLVADERRLDQLVLVDVEGQRRIAWYGRRFR